MMPTFGGFDFLLAALLAALVIYRDRVCDVCDSAARWAIATFDAHFADSERRRW